MLWPGLLGRDKYEFAKTYCDVNYVNGPLGKLFKDISRGVRLEELNVLLKQTVMIRRLKEHVLVQLPPKRRQIISLMLTRSDIAAAKSIVNELVEVVSILKNSLMKNLVLQNSLDFAHGFRYTRSWLTQMLQQCWI